ncbi:hypothetical protein TRICI_000078 [Trichomonascus ciferrii]|uniref:Uncharacterized protein n=1 Tax=Trichomonascus ciferrii TaxID=44093 RepID=A0A642VEG1_9ASCO|nr:hypothetical protein TRICI_000078 [Trichomonascus ciferrii]
MPPENTHSLSESSSLTLRFHETEDVVLTDWALDVSDNGSGFVVDEFNSDLGDTTSGTGTAEDLDDLGELDRSLVILLHVSIDHKRKAICACEFA